MIKELSEKEVIYVPEEFYKLKRSFPSCLRKDIEIICEMDELKFSLNHDTGVFVTMVNNEKLYIPERIYLIDNDDIGKYSSIQRNILYCYYTRVHNGFIREKYINKVININHDWAIPYVIKLLGEYVIEILGIIYKNIENIDKCAYKKFIENNKDFYKLTTQRVISYWDCYYRNIYKYKKDYVGFKILDFINTEVLM